MLRDKVIHALDDRPGPVGIAWAMALLAAAALTSAAQRIGRYVLLIFSALYGLARWIGPHHAHAKRRARAWRKDALGKALPIAGVIVFPYLHYRALTGDPYLPVVEKGLRALLTEDWFVLYFGVVLGVRAFRVIGIDLGAVEAATWHFFSDAEAALLRGQFTPAQVLLNAALLVFILVMLSWALYILAFAYQLVRDLLGRPAVVE